MKIPSLTVGLILILISIILVIVKRAVFIDYYDGMKIAFELKDKDLFMVILKDIYSYAAIFYFLTAIITTTFGINLIRIHFFGKRGNNVLKYSCILVISIFIILELPIYKCSGNFHHSFWNIEHSFYH